MKYVFRAVNLIFLCFLLQIIYFFALVVKLSMLSPYIYIILCVFGVFTALFIATGDDNAVYRLAWIIPILLFPAVFGIVYMFYNRREQGRRIESDILTIQKRAAQFISRCSAGTAQGNSLTAAYIEKAAGFPPAHTDARYFPDGESFYPVFLEEIKNAEKYIFIEVFIISQGVMWSEILYILSEKARQGVDVRLIYDSTGSAYTLPHGYYKTLRSMGIKCMMFNPFRPLFSVRFNVSSHRKSISIDGKIAFCGGLNFSDEYINRKPDADTGYWKDSAVMLRGGAAWNMSLMFLVMWEFVSRKTVDFAEFMPREFGGSGLASLWCDIPLDNSPLAQRLYTGLIMRANHYVYITTPYLIPPDEVLSALCLQAQSGVDVRIIMPFIPDKYLIHTVTKTFYSELLEAGVKIYEFAPGFIHSKNLVCDDKIASVGSLNLDFRSFYMHYECGVCLYDRNIISEIREDFTKTLKSCKEVTLHEYRRVGVLRRGFRRACRILAPFM